jgi:hypothetical protein
MNKWWCNSFGMKRCRFSQPLVSATKNDSVLPTIKWLNCKQREYYIAEYPYYN